jgi:hypothetical protein
MGRVALIMIGESFREGGQNTRVRGTAESFAGQREACLSHVRYIHVLRALGYDVDVYIHTLSTSYDADILKWYGASIKGVLFVPSGMNMGSVNGHFHGARRLVTDKAQYYVLMFVRIDLALKDMFLETVNPLAITALTFPSVTWKVCHMVADCPRMNDMMMFIPAKYFAVLDKVVMGHNTWHDLVHLPRSGVTHADFQLLLNTLHDSDSAKDWNPLYYIVNRHQEPCWHSKGFVFDELALRPAQDTDSQYAHVVSLYLVTGSSSSAFCESSMLQGDGEEGEEG